MKNQIQKATTAFLTMSGLKNTKGMITLKSSHNIYTAMI